MSLSGREVVGLAVQTVVGTPVTPNIMEPITSGTFSANEISEQILDQGRRGPDAMDFKAVEGVIITEISWDGIIRQGSGTVEASVIGTLFDNLLGGSSSVNQIDVTGVYDHRITLGTTKEYLTIEHTALRTSSDRQFSACRVTEITIQFNRGEGAVTYSVTLQGQSPLGVTAASLTDNSGAPHRGWEAVCLVDGNANGRLLSGEWTLRRSATPFYSTGNSQDFTDLYLGPLEVTFSAILDYSAVTDLASFRAKSQAEFSTLFLVGTEDTASERTFAIGAIVADLGDGPAELDNSNDNIRLQLTGRALYTTSNGPFSSSGNAATAQNGPVQIQIVQPFITAY